MRSNILMIIALLLSSIIRSQSDELNRVTFGIGAGYNYVFKDTYKAYLTTDTIHSLQLQKLSKSSFVISSIAIFKLGKLKGETNSFKISKIDDSDIKWYSWERLSVNLAINLLEVSSDNISFNKTIDGGLGIGYFLTSNAQLSLSYNISRYRQLHDFVKERYQNQPIPNGKDYFNALDENNSDLFYSKYLSSISFKVVFSIGNK